MLKKFDMTQFYKHTYDCTDVGNGHNKRADVNHLLRFWEEAKSEYLYKMLGGEELILSKPINYVRGSDELSSAMWKITRTYHLFLSAFESKISQACGEYSSLYKKGVIRTSGLIYDEEAKRLDIAHSFYRILYNALDGAGLVEGRIDTRYHRMNDHFNMPIDITMTVNGKPFTLSNGQKTMKIVGKLAKVFGMENEFEEFRIAHSQVLNQKTIKGMAHLSIHPLDYATASDNANGWDSCMSWLNEGCYRLGTVEMMNSPMVICAYITGNNTMEVGGDEWNSKKWRAWIIVDKDILVMNRQYPYYNSDIAQFFIDWAKELAETNLGWEYAEYQEHLYYNEAQVYLSTNYMYNDFSGDEPGCYGMDLAMAYAKHGTDGLEETHINFSGVANCMWCGEKIEPETIEASTLVCEDCTRSYHCVCCGERINNDNIYWDPNNDVPYCYDCYNETFTDCHNCGDIYNTDDTAEVFHFFDEKFMEELWKCADKHSQFYRCYNDHWRGEDSFMRPNTRYTFCKDCIKYHTDVDMMDAILYDVQVPLSQHEKNIWGMGCYRYGNILNPNKVSFEAACNLFGLPHDEEIRNVWRILWDHYTEALIAHGIINRE